MESALMSHQSQATSSPTNAIQTNSIQRLISMRTKHVTSQSDNDDDDEECCNQTSYNSTNTTQTHDPIKQTSIISDGNHPKPAIFIAHRIFNDYATLVSRKIEDFLSQDTRDQSILKTLHNQEDIVYNHILTAIGTISEFCLPSVLSTLIAWYHHQVDILDDGIQNRSQASWDVQQQQNNESHRLSLECGSLSGYDSLLVTNPSLRSPTPSSLDTTSNQMSITSVSTLQLDYQSPTSLTVISEPSHSSAANTSTSTATNASSNSIMNETTTNALKRSYLFRIRKLMIEYALCQSLIEVFKQLSLHPGYDNLVNQIEDLAFAHFKHVDTNDMEVAEIEATNQLANKFAEVIGILAQTRFELIRKRFLFELNELKDLTPTNIQHVVCLLSGMKYFRVKMAPIEEFESSFQFLHQLGEYFLEVRHKSIKHALAGLFVEVLTPLTSTVNNEVKIPCMKNFVDLLWTSTFDMCARKKHSITIFPLVTCLLCLSQRPFFLANWTSFLSMCLSNLKNRDQKMCRIALESLYRLIWIYIVRIKCESNNVTQSRLQSVVDALFPRGSRSIVPRESPLPIYVDIIHFIAQERLDFAMRHIILDLLSVDRPPTKVTLAPERMNIALQAFLVIADSLQQKDGHPIMSDVANIASLVENNRAAQMRRQNPGKMLNDELAKSIGIHPYYNQIQKSFNDILIALDVQHGKPMMLTNLMSSNSGNKEPEDIITAERKPKIELFKTCIAAIPRLIPEGMSKADLVDLLSRMTVHVDQEMRRLAIESLQILVTDLVDWRLEAIEGYTAFIANQVDSSLKVLVDNGLKTLLQLIVGWHDIIASPSSSSAASTSNGFSSFDSRYSMVSIQTGYETISSRHGGGGGQIAARKNRALAEMRLIQNELSNMRFDRLVQVVQGVEATSLVMLCSRHQSTRKLAAHLLRECRAILKCYSSWNCMEQFGLKSPDDAEEEDLSASLRGSLSADNLSRITATSAGCPAYSSVTSINTQTALSTSISRICISNSTSQHQALQQSVVQPQQQHSSYQHDPYDSGNENDIADCLDDNPNDNSALVFWMSLTLLESEREQEYLLALRLLRRTLPSLHFDKAEFHDEAERNLNEMTWKHFQGIHPLVLKGCTSSSTYEISITLLDLLTPILKHQICSRDKSDSSFPCHVLMLSTHLLANYDDPDSFCLNIARRLAIWCDENGCQKLDNLSTIMQLYSRRSFSKDAFQWTKCVVKYLYDVYPNILPTCVRSLVDILEGGPLHIQKLIAPILYCILNYIDISETGALHMNQWLDRIYNKYLGGNQWRDALQIFRLIISRSSCLASNQSGMGGLLAQHPSGQQSHQQNKIGRSELPGRTLDFAIEVVECIPVIAKAKLTELNIITAAPAQAASMAAGSTSATPSAGPGSGSNAQMDLPPSLPPPETSPNQ